MTTNLFHLATSFIASKWAYYGVQNMMLADKESQYNPELISTSSYYDTKITLRCCQFLEVALSRTTDSLKATTLNSISLFIKR
jgi:hypothetical protein